MVQAQEFINQKYPTKEQRKKVTKLDISEKNPIGILDLSDFTNLEELSLFETEINGLDLSNCINLKKLGLFRNKLVYLDLSKCSLLKELKFFEKNVKELELINLSQLKEVYCYENNQLSRLSLTNCSQLEKISGWNNKLTGLSIINCPKITWLWVQGNNLKNLEFLKSVSKLKNLSIESNQELSFRPEEKGLEIFASLEELESLDISNCLFEGSLKPLQNLNKLKTLDISNTDVDSGLEYLPDGLNIFYCSADKKKDAKVKTLEQELRKYGKPDNDFANLLKLQKEEFNSPAHQWLDENYPENGECQKETPKNSSWDNKGKKRAEITKLDISKQELEGTLNLRGFTNLERLSCSNNQLTNLYLIDCPNLIEIKCDNNELKDLNFLQPLEKLEKLWIQNNQKLSVKNLNSLSHLISLKELDISDCSKLKGSLKSLEKMQELKKISINHTNISEGLEYLPESCKELSCELDYDYSSVEIAKELNKFSQGEGKYHLDKWRTDKVNNKTASIISLERLFVIRSNLKQFLNKWGAKNGNVNELSKLKSPQEFSNYKYLTIPQWGSRAATVTGGILTLTGQPIIGGVMAAASPFVDVAATSLKESFYETKQQKWNEFLTDADTFLDNYHELLGILKKIDSDSDLGRINKTVKNLKKETEGLLEIYDKDNKGEEGYGEIDIQELIDKRVELAEDLKDKKNSKGWAIVENIKKLEDIIVAYQKDGYLIEEGSIIEEDIEQPSKKQPANQIVSYPTPTKGSCQKLKAGQIIEGIKEFCRVIQTKLETPVQCWERGNQEKQKDKGKAKEVISDNSLPKEEIISELGESSLQAQILHKDLPNFKNN